MTPSAASQCFAPPATTGGTGCSPTKAGRSGSGADAATSGPEPEVTRADFDHLLQHAQAHWTHHPTVVGAMTDPGFDGTFKGLYRG
jgi:hypothetical protein